MEGIRKDFEGSDLAFLYVYTKEPHANQKLMGFDFRDEPHTRSMEERMKNAKRCRERWPFTIPWILDDMRGSIQRAYGGLPNSGYVIRSDGVVAYKEAWANAANLAREAGKLHPPAFYLAPEKERELLLKVYEQALRLKKGREVEVRLEAAEALAGFPHPAVLPRLGAGLLDGEESVRTAVLDLLKSLVDLPHPFDPRAEGKALLESGARLGAWLKEAEKSFVRDGKTGRFGPKPAEKKGEGGEEGGR